MLTGGCTNKADERLFYFYSPACFKVHVRYHNRHRISVYVVFCISLKRQASWLIMCLTHNSALDKLNVGFLVYWIEEINRLIVPVRVEPKPKCLKCERSIQ